MARGVYQVQHVAFTTALVLHADGVALDGDPLLPLQLHIVEYLRLRIALIYSMGELYHAVGQRAFAVIDVRDYAEIPYPLHPLPVLRRESKEFT